jgi:hypothetical protein
LDWVGVDDFGNAAYVIGRTRRINDATVVSVGRLSRLERLYLSGSAVTDAGLVQLGGLAHLRMVELIGTDVGHAGLAHFKGLAGLRHARE